MTWRLLYANTSPFWQSSVYSVLYVHELNIYGHFFLIRQEKNPDHHTICFIAQAPSFWPMVLYLALHFYKTKRKKKALAGKLRCFKSSYAYLLHFPASPPLSLVQLFGMISNTEILIRVHEYYETCFMNLIYYRVCEKTVGELSSRRGGVINRSRPCSAVGCCAH